MTGVWLAVGLWIGFAAAAIGGGPAVRSWCAKEGPVEWASALVLIASVIVWSIVVARGRRARRIDPWAIVMLVFGLVVLAEELDWGAVLGVHGAGAALQSSIGHRNLHNFADGHGYLVFASVPVLAVAFGLAARISRHLAAPTRTDAIALVVAALPSVLSAWLWPAWGDEIDEVGELAIYVAVLSWSIATLRRTSGLSSVT